MHPSTNRRYLSASFYIEFIFGLNFILNFVINNQFYSQTIFIPRNKLLLFMFVCMYVCIGRVMWRAAPHPMQCRLRDEKRNWIWNALQLLINILLYCDVKWVKYFFCLFIRSLSLFVLFDYIWMCNIARRRSLNKWTILCFLSSDFKFVHDAKLCQCKSNFSREIFTWSVAFFNSSKHSIQKFYSAQLPNCWTGFTLKSKRRDG